MKKFLLGALLLCAYAPIAEAQERMVVEKTDGTTTSYTVTDVKRVYFTVDTVPSTPTAVDLGLPSGTKWASCNVGASSPEDYGDYFAWGETTTKDSYTTDNSTTCDVSYSDLQSKGIIDSDGNLTAAYDAARANWGKGWRMPTLAEIQELINNCTWTWTTYNGVSGQLVTGPNGNSIFLPAAGCRGGASLHYAGEDGYYWSSTAGKNDSLGDGLCGALGMYFHGGNGDRIYTWYGEYPRCNGRTVRPVAEKTDSTSMVEKVDLSLPSGTKWADRNVGATSPEAYGDYFAWGETTPENSSTSDNSVADGISYSDLQSKGIIDSYGNLTAAYDAATANWGDGWHMPTLTQILELLNNCTWTWTMRNGVNGYKVTGTNGNSIFLPAAGGLGDRDAGEASEFGYYWSSTAEKDSSGGAYEWYFSGGDGLYMWGNGYSRYYYQARSIRPVAE